MGRGGQYRRNIHSSLLSKYGIPIGLLSNMSSSYSRGFSLPTIREFICDEVIDGSTSSIGRSMACVMALGGYDLYFCVTCFF